MKVVLAGGTGFIGRKLMEACASAGHELVILTRDPSRVNTAAWPGVRAVQWDAVRIADWISEIDGAEAVINLAGESIGVKRWRYWQKYAIMFSRVDATRALVYAIQHAKKKPSLLVNGSAVGYYGNVESGDVTESDKKGEGFLANVCEKWEETAFGAEKLGVRVVALRIGVVIGKHGGALQRMILPFKLHVGGWLGSGRQWFPWIHIEDLVSIVMFALENTSLVGPVNTTAPEAVTMKQFSEGIGKAMHRAAWAPVPGFVLKLVLGEMSSMLLTGQRVVPSKLTLSGYSFRFPTLDSALADIFS